MATETEKLRLDKWLWYARFFKSRGIAAQAVETGIRIDGSKTTKPARLVQAGATLTFAQGRRVRVVRIISLGTRRGPASEAQALYEDLAPPDPPKERAGDKATPAPKFDGGGRPGKKDRRTMAKTRRNTLE